MKFNEKLVSLPVGTAVFAFLALAGLLGVLAFSAALPVGAQSVVTHDATVKEHSEDEVRLGAYEPDRTQIADRWELVTDVDDPAGDPAPDFPDHSHFNIDRMTGVLTFKSPPDYEDPKDSNEDNSYKVKAKFGDGEKYLAVEVTVQVTGIEEDGAITLSNRRPQVDVGLTATLEDPDKGIRSPDWQWQVETDAGTGDFTNIPRAVNRTYTPQAGDVGKLLKATARYQDGHDIDYVLEEAVSDFVVQADSGNDYDPVFRETDEDTQTADGIIQTSRRIEENTPPGTKVGPALFATDDDHLAAGYPGGEPRDELTYSLRDPANATPVEGNDATTDDDNDPNTPSASDGNAALFSIDQATGQITTKAPLDYESLDANTPTVYAYTVVVRATDPSGAAGDATLTIHVLDVDEVPELMGPAALTYRENAASLQLDRDLDTDEVQAALFRATDNDLDDETGLTSEFTRIQWEITGQDASQFRFTPSTGTDPILTYTNSASIIDPTATAAAVATAPALQFRSAPNVEAPADVGGTPDDNVYEITVRAWDGDWLIGERMVTIRVADTDDMGTITLSHIQPQVGTAITATLNDPDGISGQVSWQWYTGADPETGTEIDGATSATFTPTDQSGQLSVRATYQDRGSQGQQRTAEEATDKPLRTDPITDTISEAGGENDAPTFYVDTVDGEAIDLTTDGGELVPANEATSYTRYVLEGQTRNVRNSEADARDYDPAVTNDAAARVKVVDGHFSSEADKDSGTLTTDGSLGWENLQFDLSGPDAKYFAIRNDETPADQRGLISTKGPLDFEDQSTYTVTVTATDPAGATDTATVTINALDQAEIEDVPGDEKRVWVNEGDYHIDTLMATNPPDVSLGGLKWSLLNADQPTDPAPPANNRNDVRSVDCQFDDDNDNLCDDFRFSQFNTASTNLLFAIGTGEDHDAPDFEDPKDVVGTSGETSDPEVTSFDATGQAAVDNVYQVRVRVAFATLRSAGEANHPNPESDEMEERTYVIRVVDVDEAPSFRGADSAQSIDENSDDDLPSIMINRDLGGSVTATDPEDTTDPPDKKLTFSLSLPADYADMFHIVPSTGEILTQSRIDYEALDLTEQGTPGGQYKSITGVTVTASDSFNPDAYADTRFEPMAYSVDLPVTINVRDLNETPVESQPLTIAGDAAVSDYAEGQADTTVGVYNATGGSADSATWTLSGTDMDDFMLDPDTGGASVTLKFMSVPDFDTPTDANMDNVYMVTLTAEANGVTAPSLDVTVTVTNADEMGSVMVTPTPAVGGTELTASLTDPDGGVTNIVWDWWVDDAMDGTFEEQIAGELSATFTPTTDQEGRYIKARAQYDDAQGMDKVAASMAIEVMSADPNQALIDKYDANDNDRIDRSEVITAINDYLFGTGDDVPTRSDVITLINLYLFG